VLRTPQCNYGRTKVSTRSWAERVVSVISCDLWNQQVYSEQYFSPVVSNIAGELCIFYLVHVHFTLILLFPYWFIIFYTTNLRKWCVGFSLRRWYNMEDLTPNSLQSPQQQRETVLIFTQSDAQHNLGPLCDTELISTSCFRKLYKPPHPPHDVSLVWHNEREFFVWTVWLYCRNFWRVYTGIHEKTWAFFCTMFKRSELLLLFYIMYFYFSSFFYSRIVFLNLFFRRMRGC